MGDYHDDEPKPPFRPSYGIPNDAEIDEYLRRVERQFYGDAPPPKRAERPRAEPRVKRTRR